MPGSSVLPSPPTAPNGCSVIVFTSLILLGLWWMFGVVRPAAAGGSLTKESALAHESATDEQIRWLVDTYGRLVFRVAFSVTQNGALAEEVAQDTMVKAWTSMPSWDGDQPVKWLRVVARNQAISVMRKEGRSSARNYWDAPDPAGADTELLVETRTVVDAMTEAFATLDPESRTMIVMRETDDLSYDEIASLFEITPSAVKAKLYRARHNLKTLLREWEL